MDLNSLFANLWNYKETKALHKDVMKGSNKERFVALVSRKEATNLISDSDDSDQGETSNEEITNELVASSLLTVKHYEESRSNGF